MKRFEVKIAVAALGLLLLSGCNITKSAKLPDSQVAPVSALAFSADASLKTRLSGSEKSLLSNAESQALNFGQPGEAIAWKESKSDVSGTVTAFQPFRIGRSNCRRFVHSIKDGAEGYETSGTACRGQENVWALVN